MCAELARRGAQVALTYHEGKGVADELCRELPHAVAHALDLKRGDEIEAVIARIVDEFGRIDALIHCAAVGLGSGIGESGQPTAEREESTSSVPPRIGGPGGPSVLPRIGGPGGPSEPADCFPTMVELDEADWDLVFAVNTRSAFLASRAASRYMTGGNIVLIGSIDGEKPVPAPVHYAASKGALSAMCRAMAKELGDSGVCVNVVAPGVLEGGLSRTLPPPLEEQYLKHCSLGRRGRAEEVARVVAWLALENTYVNGRSIVLDGGL